jgi:hypothetical protein
MIKNKGSIIVLFYQCVFAFGYLVHHLNQIQYDATSVPCSLEHFRKSIDEMKPIDSE